MRNAARICVALLCAWLLVSAGVARAVTVRGTVSRSGQPVAGAFVTITGASGHAAAVTGAGGTYSLNVGAGDYQLTSQLPGTAPDTVSSVLGGSGATTNLTLTPANNPLVPTPLFGGGSQVVADGTPGVFYAAANNPGQLYRSIDWGGTWTQVDLGVDDPVAGLPETGSVQQVTTSGYPGEVAVVLSTEQVYASKDYGATWSVVGGLPNDIASVSWAHAGPTSVMVTTPLDGQSAQAIADMTAPLPTFTRMTRSYTTQYQEPWTVADGAEQPWMATLDSAGRVSIFPLSASLTAPSPLVVVPGFSNNDGIGLSLGGASSGDAPPSEIIGSGSTEVEMTVKAAGASTYPPPLRTVTDGDNCHSQPSPSILPTYGPAAPTPNSAGSYGAVWVNGCWLQDVNGQLTVPAYVGGASAAIDSGYDATNVAPGPDAVVLFGPQFYDPQALGVEKVASTSNGVPAADDDSVTPATPGPGAGSGGLSDVGITAANTIQTVPGPAALDLAAATSAGGEVSDDGVTYTRATYGLATSAAWWQGASGTWLVFGQSASSTDKDQAAAFENWSPSSPPVTGGNVTNSDYMTLGGDQGGTAYPQVDAVAGVPGADTAFVGVSIGGIGSSCSCDDNGAYWRVGLAPGPAFTNPVQIGKGVIGKPGRLAYCPVAGSAPSIQDVLIVVAEDSFGGGIYRVTSPTGESPTATEIMALSGLDGSGLPALSVDCASGTVAVSSGQTGAGPLVSTNGGQSYAEKSIPAPTGDPLQLRAVALAPGLPTTITVGDSAGYIEQSADGGATWVVVNNPSTGVNLSTNASVGLFDLLGYVGRSAARLGAASSSAGTEIVDGPGQLEGQLRSVAPTPGPAVTRFAFSPARFTAGRAGTPETVARVLSGHGHTAPGTSIQFVLSQPGTVTIGMSRQVAGRRVGKGCVATAGRVAPKQRCVTYKAVHAALIRRATAGLNSVSFTGRLGTDTLGPGTYVAVIADQTPIGRVAVPRTATFTVLTAH